MKECISPYDLFEYVGNTNPVSLEAKKTDSMGGSLAQPLKCDDEVITTYYSKRFIPTEKLKDLHFIEIISNSEFSSTQYAKYRFFTHKDNLEKMKTVLDLEDNQAYQCMQNSRACFGSANSFTKDIDFLLYTEEIFESDGTYKVLQEGIKEYGQQQYLKRSIDYQTVQLEWYIDDQLKGKTITKYLDRPGCEKLIRIFDVEQLADGSVRVRKN